jgi:hypothetical protein
MRRVLMGFGMFVAVAGLAWSQAMVEAAGAVAGGSIGGVAGKKVSDGITNVLGKVDAVAGKAAKTGKAPEAAVDKVRADKPAGGTVLQVGSGAVIKDHSLVPPPPPPVRRAAVVPPPPPLPNAGSGSGSGSAFAGIQPIPVLPPPPQVTSDDLKALASGTARKDVLKLGAPASRITMYDDGHLVEIYRYQSRDTTLGVVRLSDGSVSSVQVR